MEYENSPCPGVVVRLKSIALRWHPCFVLPWFDQYPGMPEDMYGCGGGSPEGSSAGTPYMGPGGFAYPWVSSR